MTPRVNFFRRIFPTRRLYAKGGTVGATDEGPDERDQLWRLIWEVEDIIWIQGI